MEKIILSSVIVALLLQDVESACYFSPEIQGEFVMQSTINFGTPVQYSTINITENVISIWGNCHKRLGNNVILLSGSGENSCLRCFRLKLRSRYILQVHAKLKDISTCYLSEESAVSNCPSEDSAKSDLTELILFKTKEIKNAPIQYEYCPLGGSFFVTYNINDGSESIIECSGTSSDLNTCPNGTSLMFKFRQCSFENDDQEYKCLGHWDGPNDEKYLILYEHNKRHYRCALFKRDVNTGVIHLSMSMDSTCGTHLYNATHGHEELILKPKPEENWPQSIMYANCRFPDWMHGNWEHLIVDNNSIMYRDHVSHKTYTMKCVGEVQSEDKFLIYGKTQCGEEMYNCMWIQKRGNNILEFKMGSNTSQTDNVTLCSQANFQSGEWITQGKLDKGYESPCPISGEYTGSLPDGSGLCAKLWSDCRAPELMYYQVTDCGEEIYEEREYRCVGQWREAELLYTYTQRRDVADGTYECFVGAIISEKDIYIKEAGDHCQRNIDPHKDGMRLSKQGHIPTSCVDTPISSTTSAAPATRQSTKTWTPVTHQTTLNNESNDINSSADHLKPLYTLGVIVLVLVMMDH